MRAKKLLDLVPLPLHVIKHAYSRITSTRFTTAYFIIALLYAIILSGLQLGSHISNKRADDTLLKIIDVANIQSNAIPFLSSNGDGQGILRLCNGIPSSNDDSRCQTLIGPGATDPVTGTALSVAAAPTTSSPVSVADQPTEAPTPTPQPAPQQDSGAASSTDGPSLTSQDDSGLFIAAATAASTTTDATTTTSIALPTLSLVATFVDLSIPSDTFTSASTSADLNDDDNAQTTISTSTSTSSSISTSTSTSASTTSTSTTSAASTTPTSTTSTDSTTSETSTTTDNQTTSSANIEAQSFTSTPERVEETSSSSSIETEISSSTSTSESPKSTSESEPDSNDNGSNDTASDSSSPSTELSSSEQIVPTSTSETALEAEESGRQDDASLSTSENGSENEPQTEPDTEITASSSSSPPLETARARRRRPERRKVSRASTLLRRAFDVVPVTNATNGAIIGINVTDLFHNGTSAVTFVDLRCAQTLTFPEEQLHQAWAEDLVMLGYHMWLFGLGLVAILNESIPHLLAAFVSSILALIWSIIHLVQINPSQKQWQEFVTDGACDGLEMLPSFWTQRKSVEIPAVVLNSVFVIALGVVGFRLLSVYRRQTEKLTGGSDVIKYLYKTTLVLSIIIQIAAFLLIASLALWIQQLFGSAIASFSTSTPALKGVGILSILLSLPWFYIGWFAVRREHKIMMLVFFAATIFFLGTWIVVFSSDVYRLVFTKWTFFAVITVSTFFLLVASLITSIVCRLHFGQGLAVQLTEKSKEPQEAGVTWEFSGTAEQAWEPFDKESVRQSQFTNSDRQSAFSYGLRSPVPPMPKLGQESRFSG